MISGPGGYPGEGNGNPLQYSCLENPMDRGAWQGTVHGVMKESDITEQLNNNLHSNGRSEKELKTLLMKVKEESETLA